MSAVAPSYYLVHDTPVGQRFAYPRARLTVAAPESANRWPPAASTVAEQVTIVEPAGASAVFSKQWMVTDAAVLVLRRERPGERVRDGWQKRAGGPITDGPVSPDLQAAYDQAPERPTQGEIEHYGEHDAEHACWVCKVFAASYQARYVPGEPQIETERLDVWLPLPGEPDPDPDREWVVADQSLLAVYGAHTAHLWPGSLAGLREAVGERLKAHPRVTDFYDWHGRSPDHNGFRLHLNVPWETPRTRSETYKPYGARKSRQRSVPAWAMSIRLDLFVASHVAAATKAEALAAFDRVVDEQVARFFPFGLNPRACDHCGGTGRVTGDA